MIDTDKYEGHSEDGWKVIYPDWLDRMCVATGEALYRPHCSTQETEARIANMKLMADAPLLLEEVKRLREELKQTRESLWWCYDNYRFDSHPMVDADWNFIGNLLGADMESEEE